MENKKQSLWGKNIKENSSLAELLVTCEKDFKVRPLFKEVPMLINDESKEKAYKEHPQMTIYEHIVGIPLEPKDVSKITSEPGVVYYYIAPTNQKSTYLDGWALYEVRWREEK